ncbi:hypothetical protein X943_003905 [Babesia divergens]|uniref:Uncharacterized protein n=1 Tax=Babesia divergens TaxID=32595 RepID=A0AAD9GFQ5_BABDI|nr:hypothetical protein X943_003905 [Babesia divergens]
MGAELRAAIYEKRVPAQVITEWYPYLTAHSRFFYRKVRQLERNMHTMQHLKFLNNTGQFNYYKHRRDWIEQYNTNLQRYVSNRRAISARRKKEEAREQRGMAQT